MVQTINEKCQISKDRLTTKMIPMKNQNNDPNLLRACGDTQATLFKLGRAGAKSTAALLAVVTNRGFLSGEARCFPVGEILIVILLVEVRTRHKI